MCVCKRNGKVEVWANQDFKPFECVLVPDSQDIRDRYWTFGKAVLCKGGEARHSQQKSIVIEGKKRTTPSEHTYFSPFFAVSMAEDVKTANLTLASIPTNVSVSFTLPGAKKAVEVNQKLPEISVLVNETKIKKGTLLKRAPDASLAKLESKMKKAKVEAK